MASSGTCKICGGPVEYREDRRGTALYGVCPDCLGACGDPRTIPDRWEIFRAVLRRRESGSGAKVRVVLDSARTQWGLRRINGATLDPAVDVPLYDNGRSVMYGNQSGLTYFVEEGNGVFVITDDVMLSILEEAIGAGRRRFLTAAGEKVWEEWRKMK